MQENKDKKIKHHPATSGGHHFIFSPENPVVEPKIKASPEKIKELLNSWGEEVEDTYGHYGNKERSFIVHNPKNIDKLHNLAANLGQESGLVSNKGNHELHYYHGPDANKVRHGKGSQVFDTQPEDNYTKITNHAGQPTYFQHNFDWSPAGLKEKVNKKELSNEIYKSLNNKIENSNFQTYWDIMLDKYNVTPLGKSLAIRTDGRVFVSSDGDNIGASVQRAAMADDLETIVNQSKVISAGQKVIRDWAKKNDADIYIDGGDDISFTLPKDKISQLDDLKDAYRSETGFTITIGVGNTISQAGHAMLYGKIKGKNQINEWSEKIDAELKRVSRDMSPEEKMADHGLIGEDKIPGGLADNKTKKDFDPKKLKEGIDVELEHTSDRSIAEEIAMDHLTEDPNYYRKLQELEKAVAPPKKPGEVSPDGRYVSKHHKGVGMQVWHYNPKISKEYDDFIDKNKADFVAKHPPEHQQAVSDFIDSVRNDFHRHFVIGSDKKGGTEKIRARHLKSLMQGNSNYDLKVHGPDRLSFVAHQRHGNNPKSSVWVFNTKTPQDMATGTDKGYSTKTGGYYVSKSENNTFIPGSEWSRNQSLGYDKGAVWGVSELIQYRRYNGLFRRSSSLVKASSDGKTRLVHYSTSPGLSHIDPAHMGSGLGSHGRESKYGRPGVERSYFYKENTEPENIVVGQSKARYTAELDPSHSIYDIGSDPDKIRQKLINSGKTVNPGIVTSDEYLQAVKDAGHHGFHNPNSSLPNVVALFHKHPVKEDTSFRKNEQPSLENKLMKKSEVIYSKETGWAEGVLEKSKNVREQRKKVFGTSSSPAKGSKLREKQMDHIQRQLTNRYGVEARKTPGKLNAQGKKIDKPDWTTGYLEYQDNPDAAIHEAGHFEQIPEGSTMEEHQGYMDRRFGEINRDYGYLKAKQTQDEIQPQAAENPIRRRLGLPANTNEVYVDAEGKRKGRRPEPGEEIPRAVDTQDVMAVRGKKKGKDVFLRRQSRLLSPENRERMERIDSGELVYDKEKGWVEGDSPNAKINQRVRMGAENYFKKKLAEIRANKEPEEELLASSEDKKDSKPFHGYNKKKHSKTGGLNDKAREKINKETGSNLKRPVTSKNPKGEAKSRKKSFCARMSGVKGPTSKDGKLTPKGAALNRWNCSKTEQAELEKNKDRCWDGYKPTPGKKAYTKGSCMKKTKDGLSKEALPERISNMVESQRQKDPKKEMNSKIKKIKEDNKPKEYNNETINRRISQIKEQFKPKNSNLEDKVRARYGLKKADEKTNTLDYRKMTNPPKPNNTPSLDYRKVNAPSQKPKAPSLDYRKINKMPESNESKAPSLNYGKINDPNQPPKEKPSKVKGTATARESIKNALQSIREKQDELKNKKDKPPFKKSESNVKLPETCTSCLKSPKYKDKPGKPKFKATTEDGTWYDCPTCKTTGIVLADKYKDA